MGCFDKYPLSPLGQFCHSFAVDGNLFKFMKITICGSSAFMDKMVEAKKRLTDLGHEAVVHSDYEDMVAGKNSELLNMIEKEHAETKKKHGYIKWYHNAITNSDAILVLNYDKKGIKNYIGGNTLMEIGFAHVNDKKIFLLNPIPENVSYADEIKAMADVILNGDLNKIA